MDSIIDCKFETSRDEVHDPFEPSQCLIGDRICRFCMLQYEENEMFRIPWNEWQNSSLAAMYKRIMKQKVSVVST